MLLFSILLSNSASQLLVKIQAWGFGMEIGKPSCIGPMKRRPGPGGSHFQKLRPPKILKISDRLSVCPMLWDLKREGNERKTKFGSLNLLLLENLICVGSRYRQIGAFRPLK